MLAVLLKCITHLSLRWAGFFLSMQLKHPFVTVASITFSECFAWHVAGKDVLLRMILLHIEWRCHILLFLWSNAVRDRNSSYTVWIWVFTILVSIFVVPIQMLLWISYRYENYNFFKNGYGIRSDKQMCTLNNWLN